MSCKGTNLTAIIQLTDMCNLGCKYCYVGEEGKSRMSIDTFKTALDKLIAAAGEGSVDIIYHGGEPLARGFDFIKATTKIIEESHYRERVRADIQTNGTLLDDKVAKFLVEHNISCGISLDGPKEVHDANRVYKCGKKGSFDDVMAGIDNLREAGYAPGVLSVVTKKSLGKEKEIYDFFNSEGLSFGLNPIDLVGCLKSKEDELGITPKEYGQYLISRILEILWLH